MSAGTPPPITIGGGAGGHAALTEDLERASRALEGAASEVDEAARQLRMAVFWLERAMVDALPPVRGALHAADAGVADALNGTGGAGFVAAELADAGARLATVARAYEQAEGAAQHRIGAGAWISRAGADLVHTGLFFARTNLGVAWKLSPLGLVSAAVVDDRIGDALLPDAPPPTTGYLNGRTVGAVLGTLDAPRGPLPTQYEASVGSLAAVLGLLEWMGDEPRYTGAVPRIGSASERPAPTGVADLVAGIDEVPLGGDGAVAIDTIARADGSRAHVVRIPGTQDFSVTAASPFDNRTNTAAVLGGDTDAARLVRDAMRAAGVLPTEPVMLVGHSQGGIVAATVAASGSPEFAITHVLTAGSPVDRIAHREDVQYLHLSSEQEVVHQLDGRATRDRPHVTTVVADLRASADTALAGAATGLVSAHLVSSYAATGRAADVSRHGSMTAWRAGASAFIGDGTASRREYAPTFAERRRTRRDRGTRASAPCRGLP
ncbi:hypothetical protein ACNI3K_02275 [Demequina sp. SO4-13]|uniref:PGAP1-like alpha/beta domain-containing protein n=1 Tax=Demequina sp. SO4-13 TaxID=3401027 RepID=UPI003AF4113F